MRVLALAYFAREFAMRALLRCRRIAETLAATGLLLAATWAVAAPAHADDREPSPRLLVHLLDYLAKDYGGAVSQGQVINGPEYREQVEFSESALRAGRGLAQRAPDVERGLEALSRLISSKADPQEVARLSRALEARVIAVSALQIAPVRWPNLSRGTHHRPGQPFSGGPWTDRSAGQQRSRIGTHRSRLRRENSRSGV